MQSCMIETASAGGPRYDSYVLCFQKWYMNYRWNMTKDVKCPKTYPQPSTTEEVVAVQGGREGGPAGAGRRDQGCAIP